MDSKLFLVTLLLAALSLVKAYVTLPMQKLEIPWTDVHHYSKQVRSLKVYEQAGMTNLPVGGNIYPLGIYFTQIQLGTPSKSYDIAIDTGSSSFMVSSIGCDGCRAQPSEEYDPSASSTSHPVSCKSVPGCQCSPQQQCIYGFSYETCNLTAPDQSCSVSGLVYTDDFILGFPGKQIRFGAITYQTPNFQQFYVIHGIMGMAFSRQGDSNFGGVTPFQSLYNSGALKHNAFSFCINNIPNVTENAGQITIGGADPNLYTGSFQFMPRVGGDDGLYTVNLTDITINGQSIGVPPAVYTGGFGGTVLDSGTNIIVVPQEAYDALTATFQNYCATKPLKYMCGPGKTFFDGSCFPLQQSDVESYPTIGFNFNGVELQIEGNNYILEHPDMNGLYCYGFLSSGNGGFTIVGDSLMENYYIMFDLDNEQIGWAPVNAKNCFASKRSKN